MKAVWHQVLHDLVVRRKSLAFLFVVMALVAGILNVGLGSTVQGSTLYSVLSRQLNGPDIWMVLNSEGVRAYHSGRIPLAHVAQRSPVHPTLDTTISVGNFSTNAVAIGYPTRQSTFDRIRITEGHYLSATDPQGVVVNAGLQAEQHLKVGETILLTNSAGVPQAFTIRGFEVDANGLPYPHQWVSVLTTMAALKQLSGGGLANDAGYVSFKLVPGTPVRATAIAWLHRVPAHWMTGMFDKPAIASEFQTLNLIPASFQTLFVLFSVLAGWLILSSLMATRIIDQTRQIGILKSLGFTGRQLRGIYLLENAVLGLAASIVGIVLSQPFMSLAAVPTAKVLGMASEVPYQGWLWTSAVVFLLLVTAAASFFPARRASRIVISEAIRFGAERPKVWGRGIMNFGAAWRLPLVASLAVKDLFARPFRTVIQVLTIVFAVCTITFSLITLHAIQDFQNNPRVWGQSVDAVVTPNAGQSGKQVNQAAQTVTRTPGLDGYVTTWYEESALIAGLNQSVQLFAQSSSTGPLPYIIQAGHGLQQPGDVIVGEGLLQMTGLHIGDRLSVKIAGKTANLRIVGQYFDLNNNGQEAIISKNTLARYTSPSIVAMGLELQNYHTTNAVVKDLQAKLGTHASVISNDVSVPAEGLQVKTMVRWFSMVLGFIALLTLFNTVFKSVLERQFEFGIVKSLGMRPRQIMQRVVLSGLSVVILGALIGVPLGVQVLHTLDLVMSQTMGSGLFPMPTPWLLLLGVVTAIAVAALGVSLVPAVRASYVRPIEILRTE